MGDDERMREEAEWAEYLRTSSIMSNVPVTSHPSERVRIVVPSRPPVWNRPVILLVAMPALWAAFNAVIGLVGGLWWWVIIVTILLAAVASVVLAGADRRMLQAQGHGETAEPWRAVVPLVYLLRRSALVYRANSAGYRPLWAHVGVLGCIVLAFIIVPLAAAVVGKLAESLEYWRLF